MSKANLKDKHAISLLLSSVCTPDVPEIGFCTYADGWDDDRVKATIEEQTGNELPATTVTYIRTEVFGKLATSRSSDSMSNIAIVALQQRVDRLEKAVEGILTAGIKGELS